MATETVASPTPNTGIGSSGQTRSMLLDLALPRSLWPLAAVLGSYAVAALVLPTMAPVSISDDWTYVRSVEYLVNEGRFHILPVAAATQVFQLLWGALFATLFGMTFGVLRLSTVAIVFLSGLGMYGICRELGVNRTRSALGAALYLFNPVLFPITYSFMSDPHFLALLVISAYCYLRGLRAGVEGQNATLLGSIVAALACLQRPHGALIPLAVVSYLVVIRRIRLERQGLASVLRVVAVPATTFLAYYFVISRGLPSQQGLFLQEARAAGVDETWLLFRRLTHMETVYVGLFVFPVALGLVSSLTGLVDFRRRRTWLAFLVWESTLIAGLIWFWGQDRRMPYVPHFLGTGGPGSGDLRNARPPLADRVVFDWVTIACAVAALIFGAALVQALDGQPRARRSGAGLLLAIGGWQVLGVLPQSFLFRNWVISLDRYLLPIMPFAIALMLWALNERSIRLAIAWSALAAIAFFSTAGTRDVLVFQRDVWSIAGQLNAHGVSNTSLDAGYAWDAYHLWEFGHEYQIERRTPDGTWWTDAYAPATDSTYVIAGGPIPGYTVLSVHPYSAWLQRQSVALYVLRRESAPPDGIVWP